MILSAAEIIPTFLTGGRLLSQAGVPKLRRMARERLKLKGKGHEVHDLGLFLRSKELMFYVVFRRQSTPRYVPALAGRSLSTS